MYEIFIIQSTTTHWFYNSINDEISSNKWSYGNIITNTSLMFSNFSYELIFCSCSFKSISIENELCIGTCIFIYYQISTIDENIVIFSIISRCEWLYFNITIFCDYSFIIIWTGSIIRIILTSFIRNTNYISLCSIPLSST